MYGSPFSAIVSAPKGKLKDAKGNSTRLIEFVIKVDFGETVAAFLDKSGKAALSGLRARGLSKVEIPIDSEGANITLKVGKDKCKIMSARGVKIAAKANMNEPEDAPTANIHWRFTYEDESWQFLGRNFGSTCEVLIEKQQLELLDGGAGDEPAEKVGKGKKLGKGEAAAAGA